MYARLQTLRVRDSEVLPPLPSSPPPSLIHLENRLHGFLNGELQSIRYLFHDVSTSATSHPSIPVIDNRSRIARATLKGRVHSETRAIISDNVSENVSSRLFSFVEGGREKEKMAPPPQDRKTGSSGLRQVKENLGNSETSRTFGTVF